MYADAIALALRLITQYGEASTLRRRVDPPAAPRQWEPGAPSYVSHAVRAVWFEESKRRADGDVTKAGDQVVYVAASGMTVAPDPSVDVLVRASGEVWSIVASEPLCPNGETILYKVVVKR